MAAMTNVGTTQNVQTGTTSTSGHRPPARIMIWGTPRSMSTAFARSMSSRGDTEVFWEPYLNCYVYGPDRAIDLIDKIPHMTVNNKYTYEYVNELLNAEYPGANVLFVKGMVQGLRGHFPDANPNYKHSFLIRHPRKTFASINRMATEFPKMDAEVRVDEMVLGMYRDIFHDLERFYHYVETELGQPSPPVIDADDVMSKPEIVLPKWCAAMGIEYTPKMLRWESVSEFSDLGWHCTDVGPVSDPGINHTSVVSNAMLGNAFGKAPKLNLTEAESSPPSTLIAECIDHAMPVYERLHSLRITA